MGYFNPAGVTPAISSGPNIANLFAATLYTGTGSATQTITSGIDLSTLGGLAWIKDRSTVQFHNLIDTIRGPTNRLSSNSTNANSNDGGSPSFNTNGITVANASSGYNNNGDLFIAWSFAKSARFFDIQTFTATSNSNRRIGHNLGVVPGLVIVKSTTAGETWWVYHISQGRNASGRLDTTLAFAVGSNKWGTSDPTTTDFGIAEGQLLTVGATYVAYFFAHDPAADGVIQCGSFTTDGVGNATVSSIGWQPQYLLVKSSSTTGNWILLDSARGWSATDYVLSSNLSAAETSATDYGAPTSTGFTFANGGATVTYIFMAIRSP